MKIEFQNDWQDVLREELQTSFFKSLTAKVEKEYLEHPDTTFPSPHQIFRAFELCDFHSLRVVILGQDPYHGHGQAEGLSFSVTSHTKLPPSLKNIFKEIQSDIGSITQTNGHLAHWAEQGVLLLNSTLTVHENQPGSHQKFGWEHFTDSVIKKISAEKEHVVFLLWGRFAQAKRPMIDENKHLILEAPHPSPLSAHRGFFGCRHFSKTNACLKDNNLREIKW